MIAAISEPAAISDASRTRNGCITKRQCICGIVQSRINVPGTSAVKTATSAALIQIPPPIFRSGIKSAAKNSTVSSAPNPVTVTTPVTCAQ